ncbi:MAG: DUF2306 domain-containing protein [Acidimicrobiales bacterium]
MALVVLSAVPVLAGTARLVQLASAPAVTDENRRFVESPAPVVAHVVAATVFCLGGALLLTPSLRARRPDVHAALGRVVAPAGAVAAATGLWMTHRYELPSSDNAVLGVVRDVVGVGMLAVLAAGIVAVRDRRFAAHGAWMARAYALGLGAGTQVLTTLVWIIPFGTPTPMVRAGLMAAGWAINLTVVEVVLWRQRVRRRARAVRRPAAAATLARSGPRRSGPPRGTDAHTSVPAT